MPRKKKKEDEWLPQRVYRGRSAFEYKSTDGQTIRLCGLDAPKWHVLDAYKNILQSLEDNQSVYALASAFLNSPEFEELSDNVKYNYRLTAKRDSILMTAFGNHHANYLKPQELKRYRNNRKKRDYATNKLVLAPSGANNDLKFLKAVYRWGMEEGLVTSNVIPLIQKNKEQPKDVYIPDDVYYALLEECSNASRHTGIMLWCGMEIAYRCALRIADLLSLTTNHMTEEGLIVTQSKIMNMRKDNYANHHNTSIKLWTDELRQAVDIALNQTTSVDSIHIIRNRFGRPYTESGFRSIFNPVRLRVSKRFGRNFHNKTLKGKRNPDNFSLHDLKAKGISDFAGNKQDFSGHKSAKMIPVYDRKLKHSPTLGSPLKQ